MGFNCDRTVAEEGEVRWMEHEGRKRGGRGVMEWYEGMEWKGRRGDEGKGTGDTESAKGEAKEESKARRTRGKGGRTEKGKWIKKDLKL